MGLKESTQGDARPLRKEQGWGKREGDWPRAGASFASVTKVLYRTPRNLKILSSTLALQVITMVCLLRLNIGE